MRMLVPKDWEDRSHLLKMNSVKSIIQAICNDTYSVQLSRENSRYGLIHHLWMRRHDERELTWYEKYMLKNILIGDNYTAIEIFPRKDMLVDDAMMYHLYVMPYWFTLDFGLHLNKSKGENENCIIGFGDYGD